MIRFRRTGIGSVTPESPWVLLLGERNEAIGRLLLADSETGCIPPLMLIETEGADWDADFSPWPFDAGARRFAGKAGALYAQILGELNPQMPIFLCGYSLAGLAALYFAGLGKERFCGCASCSGSLWYPGFPEWLKAHPPQGPVYLSLGGKEKNTHDPLMATIETCTDEVYRSLKQNGSCCFFHEPGGHFRDPAGRIERGIRYLLQNGQSSHKQEDSL